MFVVKFLFQVSICHDEFFTQPPRHIGAGIIGYCSVVSASAGHTPGKHGTVSGRPKDGAVSSHSTSVLAHQYYYPDSAATRGPSVIFQRSSTSRCSRKANLTQVRLIQACQYMTY